MWVCGAVATSILVGACMTMTVGKSKPGASGILINHALHAEQSLDCTTCHEPQDGMMSMPTHEICSVCHEIDVDNPTEESCGLCHTRDDYTAGPRTPVLSSELLFTHEPHAASEIECAVCHTNPDAQRLVKAPIKPFCMDCHGETRAELNECSVCHSQLNTDVVPTHRGSSRIQHDAPEIWEAVHGRESKVDPQYCAMCHELQAFCDECHQQQAPQDHTVAWRRKTHGVKAQWDRTNCAVCHEEDSCMKCHQNTEPVSHRRGWAEPLNRHCVSCHFPPTDTGCVVCHEAVDHQTSTRSPHRFGIYPQNCAKCHPGGLPNRAPHPTNSTTKCQLCH